MSKHETEEEWSMRRAQELADETGRPHVVLYSMGGSAGITEYYPKCEGRDDYLCTVRPKAPGGAS